MINVHYLLDRYKDAFWRDSNAVIYIALSLFIQYPDHVRTAASNVAKSLPPPPILLENEAAAANFEGK